MSFVSGLKCRECGREYPAGALNVCDFCFGPLEVVYDYETISEAVTTDEISRGPLSIWRYKDLLPASGDDPVDIMAGFTPMIKARNLGKRLGLNNLYIKNDSVNPSYSFKDRVVSVAATKAIEFGFETLACASTGNLACSVAAHAARAGIRSVVFIPSDLERGKVIGAAVYGPTMVAVDGTYDEVNRLCSEVGDNYPWAFVNINMRPYYAEGSKTLGYEVAEQLGWRLPDHVIVPSASGAMFTKIWKGFNELACLGLLDGVDAMSFGADQNTVHHPAVTTRMHMAQAEGCSPIVTAWKEGTNPSASRAPQQHRQVPGHRQPRRRHLRPAGHQQFPGQRQLRPRVPGRRGNQAPGRDRGHLHRDCWRRGNFRVERPGRVRGHRSR